MALLLSIPLLGLVGGGPDFENYAEFFQIVRESGLEAASEQRFEPVFARVAVMLAQIFSSDVATFGGLMFASLATTLYAMSRCSAARPVVLAVCVFYLARFMPLHEMTQLRIALALGCSMLAVVQRRSPVFWIAISASVFTHYSAVVLMPILFAGRFLDRSPQAYARSEWHIWLTSLGLFAASALAVKAFIEPLSLAFVALDMYSNGGFGDDGVNLLPLSVVVDAAFRATAVLLVRSAPNIRFWLWVRVLAIVLFVALSPGLSAQSLGGGLASDKWLLCRLCSGVGRGVLLWGSLCHHVTREASRLHPIVRPAKADAFSGS